MAAAVRSVLDDQMLDELVAKMRTDGVRLSGPGGFLTEMLKAVLERGLQSELTEHLGYASMIRRVWVRGTRATGRRPRRC